MTPLLSILAAISLIWDHSPDAATLATYRMHCQRGQQEQIVNVGTTNVATLTLPAGSWSFYVTAVGPTGIESDPSNILQFDVRNKGVVNAGTVRIGKR